MQREEGDTEQKQKKQKQNQKRHTKNVQRVVVAVVVVYWLTRLNVFLLLCCFVYFVSTHVASLLLLFVVYCSLSSVQHLRPRRRLKWNWKQTHRNQATCFTRTCARSAARLGCWCWRRRRLRQRGQHTHTHTQALTQFVCTRSVFSFGILRAWCW